MPSSRGWLACVSRTPYGSTFRRRGKIATRIDTPRKRHVIVTQMLLLPFSSHGRTAAASSPPAIASASV
jgi:hypothetical protein